METQVASNMGAVTTMDFAPDGRLFVDTQGGDVRITKNGTLLSTPFIHLNVDSNGERGVLGVTFDPNFASNHFVYLYYTATTPAIHNRVSRFTDNPNTDTAVSGSEVDLLDLPNLGATNHNGGAIHFGPDGKLYIAVGENTVSSNSQTLSNPLGKMLRINSDGSIPSDNPFFNQTTGISRAIWALGLRNPYSFSFQPGTGVMFINDVGQSTWEETNRGAAGANYGWPNSEGFRQPNDPVTTIGTYTDPLFEYGHGSGDTVGIAIVGSAFYNPTSVQFPSSYVGKYFFADLGSGWIRTFDPETGATTVLARGINTPVDLKVAPDGTLYYLAQGGSGSVFRIQSTEGAQVTASSPAGSSGIDHVRLTFSQPISRLITRGRIRQYKNLRRMVSRTHL